MHPAKGEPERGSLLQRIGGRGRSRARRRRTPRDVVLRRGNGFRATEPRQGAAARPRRATLHRDPPDTRRAPRVARDFVVGQIGDRCQRGGGSGGRPARRAARPRRRSPPVVAVDRDVERHRAGRPAARVRSDRRNGVARRQRPGPRRAPRRGPGLSRIREFRRAAKLARHHDIQPAMEPLLSHRQGRQGVVLRLRLERSGPE